MSWDLPDLIEHNRKALLRLLAALFAMIGSLPGGALVQRAEYLRVLQVLRPAESAARRLIFAEAQALAVPPPPVRSGATGRGGARVAAEHPAFALFDRRNPFDKPARRKPGIPPRILDFSEDYPGVPEAAVTVAPSADDLVDAGRLVRRLLALQQALGDVPAQALRMARTMARRHLAPPGRMRMGPLRAGRAPGQRARHMHEVDDILAECAWIARRAQEPPLRR